MKKMIALLVALLLAFSCIGAVAEEASAFSMSKLGIPAFTATSSISIDQEQAMALLPMFGVPDEYAGIVTSVFQESGTPCSFALVKTTLSQAVRNWLTRDRVSRDTVLLLGFGLYMSVDDVNAFLVKALGAAVGFLAGMADWRLIREWIPAGVTAVTRFFARLPESRLVQKGIPAAVTAVTRFAAEATDMLALILRRTVFRWKKARRQVPVGNRLTWCAGGWLNRLTRGRARRKRRDYREVLAMDAAALNRRSERILGSVSYGLLLLAFGLLVTLVYLLVQ